MTYQKIRTDPLSPIIGAEVSGVDISKPLDKDVLEEVNRALLDHQVIFFRDQKMSLERHKAFGRNFGSSCAPRGSQNRAFGYQVVEK